MKFSALVAHQVYFQSLQFILSYNWKYKNIENVRVGYWAWALICSSPSLIGNWAINKCSSYFILGPSFLGFLGFQAKLLSISSHMGYWDRVHDGCHVLRGSCEQIVQCKPDLFVILEMGRQGAHAKRNCKAYFILFRRVISYMHFCISSWILGVNLEILDSAFAHFQWNNSFFFIFQISYIIKKKRGY